MKGLVVLTVCAVSLGAAAQTTFNVDMTCAHPPDFDNVFVTGPWCGWCLDDANNTMTDPDGDGIYTVVLDETSTGLGLIEYKYAIDGFDHQEDLVNDMNDGAACAPVTDYFNYANRTIQQGSVANDFYGTCDGTCNDAPPLPGGTVTFKVDMSNYTGPYSTVNLNGGFNSWCGGCAPMSDDDGDMVYELDMELDGGTYEYLFSLDGWSADQEVFEGGAQLCTSTIDGYTNRTIEVSGDTLLPPVCWNSCEPCGGARQVVFRVDMSNEEVSPFGVHVAGDFQGWDPATTELSDPDGDMIYETTQLIDSSFSQITFKFINGNTWTDAVEQTYGDCGDTDGNGNRTLELGNETNIVLSANDNGDAYCFNRCSACPPLLPVTFTVDMSLLQSQVSEQGVYLAGSFQGWDPESTMLTDNGDGTWSTTLEIEPGEYQFKFINGAGWGGEENMNGTNCGEGGNRIAHFDGYNTTYTTCFERCPGESCLPDPDPANLTFQVDASEVDMMGESMYLFAGFSGWQGGAIEMTDLGNGIWQTTQLVSGSANVDYKYSIGYPDGGMGIEESGSYGVGCNGTTTFEVEGCGVGNGFGGFDRRFVRSGVDEVIPLHCFNRCDACLDGNQPQEGLLYFQNFDAFSNGDAITEVSQAFELWPLKGSTDAYVTNEASWSCNNALKIEGELTGGPMDVVLIAGIEGIHDLTFHILVPAGYSGYYNIQENIVAGVEWAFECYLNSDGTIRYAVDPATDGSGGPEITATYNHGAWVEIKHQIDTDTDVMNIIIDGVCVGELPYDGEQLGGLNFFAAGDGVNPPLYYVDDISFTTLAALPACIFGCTDPSACNYESSAIEDDGSCDYSCLGCTNPQALNHNPAATVDDGSCIVFVPNCDFIGNSGWANYVPGIYLGQAQVEHELGVFAAGEFVLHVPGTFQDGAGGSFNVFSWDNLTWSGLPEGVFLENEPVAAEANTQLCLSYSGTPYQEGVFEVSVMGDLVVSVFGNPVAAGGVSSSFTMVITPSANGVLGCTYANASNFLPVATIDDGSCVYLGCMDPEASNFQIFATTDDGSCSYGCTSAEGPCMFDSNNDGSVGSSDLLLFLTAFGVTCE